jgi:hypothetical protein
MADQHASTQHVERSVNDNRASQSTTVPTAIAKPPPPEPTGRERWRVARPTKMVAFWLCLGAIVLTMIVGFTWGGWTTKDAAQKQANSAAQTAVVQRLAKICVAQFGNDGEHAQKLVELQALGTSARSSFVSDSGWATMPGEEAPDSKVVSECVKQVLVVASN